MSEVAGATSDEPVVSDPLGWPEIRARYPDQWVALIDVDWIDDGDTFRSARVAGHGPRRRDPLEQVRASPVRYDEVAHFFTGRIRLAP